MGLLTDNDETLADLLLAPTPPEEWSKSHWASELNKILELKLTLLTPVFPAMHVLVRGTSIPFVPTYWFVT
jgi:hypothetical protein